MGGGGNTLVSHKILSSLSPKGRRIKLHYGIVVEDMRARENENIRSFFARRERT